MMAARAVAQDVQQIPAVEVHPVGTTRNDPNGGQWFITQLDVGETKQLQVRLYNPADVAQTVKVYLADLRFDAHGVPEVANESTDIGTWGRFDVLQIAVQPKQSVIQSLAIAAPEGADPGDHIGAVVAEQSPQGTGPVQTIKRLAVRLYATVPGDARKDFVIDKVDVKKDSPFYTRELGVTVWLRNTGRVRLEPSVHVDGAAARGTALLLAQSAERYITTRPVGFFGGPVRMRVDAQTISLGLAGPVRQLQLTVWVIPWHLFGIFALAAGLAMLVRLFLRRRRGRYDSIRSDIRRLERLITREPEEVASEHDADPTVAIRAAIKQARRAGDERIAERLEGTLNAAGATQVATAAEDEAQAG